MYETVQFVANGYDGHVGGYWSSNISTAQSGGYVSNGSFNQYYSGGIFRSSRCFFGGINDWRT